VHISLVSTGFGAVVVVVRAAEVVGAAVVVGAAEVVGAAVVVGAEVVVDVESEKAAGLGVDESLLPPQAPRKRPHESRPTITFLIASPE
jgi:hypothetical protein